MSDTVLCSNCFRDEGLRLDSFQIGDSSDSACINCGSTDGRKLTRELVLNLAHRFFVRGTTVRTDFGAAPVIVFNGHQRTSISVAPWLEADVRLIEKTIGVGFFRYGPHLWTIGEIEPLKDLQRADKRPLVLDRIVSEYPNRPLTKGEIFYRIRRAPQDPSIPSEYDSPPKDRCGCGRLDSIDFPVLYGSQDLQICVHECRIAIEDEVFVASLSPTRDLNLLDLTHLLEEDGTEFESLDIAVHMLFLAGKHAYEISRAIALAASRAGYDGVVYPSYFSLVRTGGAPFATIYGISIRKFPQLTGRAKAQIIPNVGIFGRPIEQGLIVAKCIDRLILNKAEYDLVFGPVGYK